MRGATPIIRPCSYTSYCFNSRTPCGVRPQKACRRAGDGGVSIHAPRAGCDARSPATHTSLTRFQFTHPVRGATSQMLFLSLCLCCFNSRTPCGVRHPSSRASTSRICFNSRTPCGVRHPAVLVTLVNLMFQFTHPVRGATSVDGSDTLDTPVSIHAPRAGCDKGRVVYDEFRGEFQFTHPVRGATLNYQALSASSTFQFTHPVWGATTYEDSVVRLVLFQFTHPVWGATCCNTYYILSKVVSIHAPRVGCDRQAIALCLTKQVSIHAPRVGCDLRGRLSQQISRVSIHAPRVGCDKTIRRS